MKLNRNDISALRARLRRDPAARPITTCGILSVSPELVEELHGIRDALYRGRGQINDAVVLAAMPSRRAQAKRQAIAQRQARAMRAESRP
jgi:hypothetical protein